MRNINLKLYIKNIYLSQRCLIKSVIITVIYDDLKTIKKLHDLLGCKSHVKIIYEISIQISDIYEVSEIHTEILYEIVNSYYFYVEMSYH